MKSDDGAHYGYGMSDALGAALGGSKPEDEPKLMTTMDMRAYIESAPDKLPKPGDDAWSSDTYYDTTGRMVAKAVLRFLEAHPEASDMPADSEHEWPKGPDGQPDWTATPTITTMGLYDYIKQVEPELRDGNEAFAEMTGFQWGWAVNAARRCLELPPVANPAIIEVGVG